MTGTFTISASRICSRVQYSFNLIVLKRMYLQYTLLKLSLVKAGCLMFLLTYSIPVKAQQSTPLNEAFLLHLKQNNLAQERLSYYHTIDFLNSTSTNLTKDIVYLSAKFNDTLLLKKYALYARDSNDLMLVYYGALAVELSSVIENTIEDLTTQLSAEKLQELKELHALLNGKVDKLKPADLFYTTTKRIITLEKKSVLLASICSMIIPGSGKYYLLQHQEATSALLLNVLAAAPFIECILKLGLYSTASVLTGLVFLPVYIATVYGTSISKKSLLKKLHAQLHHEVLDYCNFQLRN